MKNFLSKCLAFIVVTIGFLFVLYYLQNEFSVITFVLGLLGFLVSFTPAYEKWKEFFNEIIK